jgi:hypothetical protein
MSIVNEQLCKIEDSVIPTQLIPIPIPIPMSKTMPQWFIPTPQDSLFWCIFVSVYGDMEYKMIGTKFANREWEEKNKIRAAISTKEGTKMAKSTNQKITLGNVQEMMSEYMTNQTRTTLLGVIGCAVYYKMEIVLVNEENGTHISFCPECIDLPKCIIYKTNKGRYKLYLGADVPEKSFGLESYSKPLRAISTYKRQELEEIAERFNVSICGKKKDELYRVLTEKLVWRE